MIQLSPNFGIQSPYFSSLSSPIHSAAPSPVMAGFSFIFQSLMQASTQAYQGWGGFLGGGQQQFSAHLSVSTGQSSQHQGYGGHQQSYSAPAYEPAPSYQAPAYNKPEPAYTPPKPTYEPPKPTYEPKPAPKPPKKAGGYS